MNHDFNALTVGYGFVKCSKGKDVKLKEYIFY